MNTFNTGNRNLFGRWKTFFLIVLSVCVIPTAHSETKGGNFTKSYYIDPNIGNDRYEGTSKLRPWKTFKRINRLVLFAGTTVEIISAGTFYESLLIKAKGNQHAPVKVKFAAGRYHFYPDFAEKRLLHISNTNDKPDEKKAIALLFEQCYYLQVQGKGATIILHGKMIETFVNTSDQISISGLSFDYNRPTVSELKVTEVGQGYADAVVHPDSKYSIKDSAITWLGDGWQYQPDSYWQVFNPETNLLSRISVPMDQVRFIQKDGRKIRILFKNKVAFEKGKIYQNRNVTRDCAGVFMQLSRNIQLDHIRFYFIHGMGIVSQYCHNISINGVAVRPAESSGRTCAAWADILHFSGCSGKIQVSNSYLSAANDDAINVHGVHLQIIEIQSSKKIRVKFMHDQTYGFDAFAKGDSIAYIAKNSLLSMGENKVLSSEKLNDKEFLLTLMDPIAAKVQIGDALENISATAEVWIHHNILNRIPTRGILVTTRRKVLIEHNRFENIKMSGIFINDDASNWFESGMVKDVTIRDNRFYHCGGPVIGIHPENTVSSKTAVHKNIIIVNNYFWLEGTNLLEAKSTRNIRIFNNRINNVIPSTTINMLMKFSDCNEIKIHGNKLL